MTVAANRTKINLSEFVAVTVAAYMRTLLVTIQSFLASSGARLISSIMCTSKNTLRMLPLSRRHQLQQSVDDVVQPLSKQHTYIYTYTNFQCAKLKGQECC